MCAVWCWAGSLQWVYQCFFFCCKQLLLETGLMRVENQNNELKEAEKLHRAAETGNNSLWIRHYVRHIFTQLFIVNIKKNIDLKQLLAALKNLLNLFSFWKCLKNHNQSRNKPSNISQVKRELMFGVYCPRG